MSLAAMTLFAACSVAPPAAPSPTASVSSTATPSPSASSWGQSPSETPTPPAPAPIPSVSASTTGPDATVVLEENAVYAVKLRVASGTCTLKVVPPRPPLANKKLEPYVKQIVGCLNDTFAGPLGKQGVILPAPTVDVFTGTLTTPCGKLTATGAPAYYCAATTTMYWPATADEHGDAFTYARLGYLGLAAHEYGHHLQAATGILDAYARLRLESKASRRDELTRRLELQAQCFEGIFLGYQRDALKLTGQDRYELDLWHSATGDEDPPKDRRPDHGSSAAQSRWLQAGLDHADFGRCNTWAASAASVK